MNASTMPAQLLQVLCEHFRSREIVFALTEPWQIVPVFEEFWMNPSCYAHALRSVASRVQCSQSRCRCFAAGTTIESPAGPLLQLCEFTLAAWGAAFSYYQLAVPLMLLMRVPAQARTHAPLAADALEIWQLAPSAQPAVLRAVVGEALDWGNMFLASKSRVYNYFTAAFFAHLEPVLGGFASFPRQVWQVLRAGASEWEIVAAFAAGRVQLRRCRPGDPGGVEFQSTGNLRALRAALLCAARCSARLPLEMWRHVAEFLLIEAHFVVRIGSS